MDKQQYAFSVKTEMVLLLVGENDLASWLA